MNIINTTSKADKSFNRLHEIDDFMANKPMYARLIGQLIVTVSSCPESGLAPPRIPFESAHIHVYGDASSDGCVWCQQNFKIAADLASEVYDKAPAIHSLFE